MPMQFPIDCRETERKVERLQIHSYSGTKKLFASRRSNFILCSEWNVGGYDWVILYYPNYSDLNKDWSVFRLALSRSCANEVKVTLRCQLVDESGSLPPFGDQCVTYTYTKPLDPGTPLLLVKHEEILNLGYLKNDSFAVECSISVQRRPQEEGSDDHLSVSLPSPDMHQQIGELLQSRKGADVTFVVSGESFTAHKVILAARSPIFMAEFFGHMKECSSEHVEIKGIEPAAFKAMLHFIYTDTCPELAQQHAKDVERKEVTAMAQHLLAAADRYGLDRLKLICEDKLYHVIDVDMVATTLVLADQHGCSRLKKRCIEFMVASPVSLDAVMATEGYKHLMASCPFPTDDVLRAAVARR